ADPGKLTPQGPSASQQQQLHASQHGMQGMPPEAVGAAGAHPHPHAHRGVALPSAGSATTDAGPARAPARAPPLLPLQPLVLANASAKADLVPGCAECRAQKRARLDEPVLLREERHNQDVFGW
ncbi:unnamed protein product, partial [Discosporangium mesarthrocarpum]